MPAEPDDHQPAPASAPGGGRGADLAREILAQAKRDARERARGRRGGSPRADGSWPGSSAGGPGPDGAAGVGGDPAAADRAGRRPRSGEDDGQVPQRPRLPGIAAPGREWRDPVPFGTAISRLLATRGWKAQADDAGVLARWDAIVGPDIADHCTPVSLRDGDLELVAESTAWATQLRMLSRQILAILHRELGPQVVRRITVRGPTAPSWRHGPIRTAGRGPRDTYG
ncbi:putative RNA-binding protein containing Zn ribbon [Frankia torreyi]|uniref:Putative RNA-binding protein containing Zn ribbon n=1 Tax=Frankia torreyi TaxID=1856 RepID=A0A0D8BFD8_9ACTN|nr:MULTISPECIES: DciA family protein [Frankia]KJE22694.1 putative RNA-binding protein containing Zn ribbon [Frankia torreyi]KQM04481.1 putative RNA-binding protein containing Zn ribbon [Frankia sp. CpI1-P]